MKMMQIWHVFQTKSNWISSKEKQSFYDDFKKEWVKNKSKKKDKRIEISKKAFKWPNRKEIIKLLAQS